MHAPLAMFLTHFTAPPPMALEVVTFPDDPPELGFESEIIETGSDVEARIESAVEEARLQTAEQHQAEIAALAAAHEERLTQALAAAREEWVASTAADFERTLADTVSELRTTLSERIANVLRPLLANAVQARATAELSGALDRLLADSNQPLLRMSGPEDLAEALLTGRPAAAIEWTVADTVEVELIADGTRIETKLAAALAEIAATESTDVG